METRTHIFNCGWCHTRVFICTKRDHRNKYCGLNCAKMARQKYLHRTRTRYQNSRKGKLNHAKRQKRYRERQKQVKK
jgi:hypothetical protein